jgi:hypothetical protein
MASDVHCPEMPVMFHVIIFQFCEHFCVALDIVKYYGSLI